MDNTAVTAAPSTAAAEPATTYTEQSASVLEASSTTSPTPVGREHHAHAPATGTPSILRAASRQDHRDELSSTISRLSNIHLREPVHREHRSTTAPSEDTRRSTRTANISSSTSTASATTWRTGVSSQPNATVDASAHSRSAASTEDHLLWLLADAEQTLATAEHEYELILVRGGEGVSSGDAANMYALNFAYFEDQVTTARERLAIAQAHLAQHSVCRMSFPLRFLL